MSGRRAALLERFRARARERVAALADALGADAPADRPQRDELLGALHTLKGEARMLGLVSIAQLAHAIEERLHDQDEGWVGATALRVQDALDALDTVLLDEQLTENDWVERTAADARAALVAATKPPPSPSAAPTPLAASPREARRAAGSLRRSGRGRDRLLEVRASQVDAIADGLDELRACLARARRRARAGELDPAELEEIHGLSERLAQQGSELRLAPVEPALVGLANHARELAAQQGKRVEVKVEGSGVELERAVLDALEEPLIHLVRNAIDHGVAQGRPGVLTLRASASGDGASIEVRDDGVGIVVADVREAAIARGAIERAAAFASSDGDVLDLVFRPGVSTRATATEVSGRGMGLDVVRRVVESLGGAASVTSGADGTAFSLTVPVGLARERVLVVPSGGLLFGLPVRVVRQVVDLTQAVMNRDALRLVDGQVPLRSFADLVGVQRPDRELVAVVVEIGERRWALGVAEVIGERDALRRPADRPLATLGVASASSVLDDGRPVLLPTLSELLRRAGARGSDVRPSRPRSVPALRRALVVDDSPIVRELVRELLSAAGFVVTEAPDGAAALEIFEGSPFDIVVSDLEMPRLDGFGLVRALRERGAQTPVVIVTTRGSVEDRRRAAECGANAYVVKTEFSESALVDTVNRLAQVGS